MVCRQESTIGTVDIVTIAEHPGAFDDLLDRPDLRALVVLFEDTLSADEGERVAERLEAVSVPTGAVLPAHPSDVSRRIAGSCHFSFPSRAAAATHLLGLTDRRPARVIRAVMRSIHNSGHMTLEDALLEETRLFVELSAAKRRARKAAR